MRPAPLHVRRGFAVSARPQRQGSRIVADRAAPRPRPPPTGVNGAKPGQGAPNASAKPFKIPTLRAVREEPSGGPVGGEAPPADQMNPDNDPFIRSLQQLQRGMEAQKAEIADDLAEVVRTPEWKAYDREVETEIARLEDEWLRSPKPVTKDTVAELQAAISAKVDELSAKYQARVDQREERVRAFPQTLNETQRRDWERLLRETPPPKPLKLPLTFEEFERAFAGHMAPGTPQPPSALAADDVQALESPADSLRTLGELLAPVAASIKKEPGKDKH